MVRHVPRGSTANNEPLICLVVRADAFAQDEDVVSRPTAPRALRERRPYAFAQRTFLYVAYAEHSGRIFHPDTARGSLVGSIVKEEGLFRERLLKALRQAGETPEAVDQSHIVRLIPPLAAMVFDKASHDRSKIGTEILKLRSKMTPLRRRLRESEAALHHMTAVKAKEEVENWKEAIASIATALGPSAVFSETQGMLAMAGAVPKLVLNPKDFGAWKELLVALKPAGLKRLLARRRVVQLRKLMRRSLPGPVGIEDAVDELFGPIAG